MKFGNENHEAANQFDAIRFEEVRRTYDIDSNTLEYNRLRHKLKRMSETDTGEMPSLDSASFATVSEGRYVQKELEKKIEILEAIVAEQLAEEEKEAA